MKQSKIIAAYKALQTFSDAKLPTIIAYKLYKLKKALEPQYEFQGEQEQVIVEDTGAQVKPDGTVTFKDKQTQADFFVKMKELANMEVDLDIQPIELSIDDLPRVSVNDLESLSDFIILN